MEHLRPALGVLEATDAHCGDAAYDRLDAGPSDWTAHAQLHRAARVLDQNKWVDLARSRKTGFTDGLADFWNIAHAGVERDLLSFPLSAVHYFEMTKRVRQDSRWDLAAAMAELSRMHTIAGANTLIPQEVDAVAARIYRDQIDPNAPDPSPIEPFGVGAAHALGAPPGTFAGQFSFEELRAAGMPEDMLTLVVEGWSMQPSWRSSPAPSPRNRHARSRSKRASRWARLTRSSPITNGLSPNT